MEVHQFRPDAIGIVKVELPLAVFADLWLIVMHAGQTVAILKLLVSLENRDFANGEVVEDAKIVLRDCRGDTGARWTAGEHIFEPIVAVGSLLADPVDLALDHAAKPVGAEAEQIAIERILNGAAVDQEPDMDDVVADGIGSDWRLGIFRWLNELDLVAFRVFYSKPAAAVGAFLHPVWYLPRPGTKIPAQAFRVVGIEGRVVKPVDAGIRGQGDNLNKLRGAERVAHTRGVFGVGKLCPRISR